MVAEWTMPNGEDKHNRDLHHIYFEKLVQINTQIF